MDLTHAAMPRDEQDTLSKLPSLELHDSTQLIKPAACLHGHEDVLLCFGGYRCAVTRNNRPERLVYLEEVILSLKVPDVYLQKV